MMDKSDWMIKKKEFVTDVFVHSILVNGPDCGHVSSKKLRQRDMFVASPGADEPSLADGGVPDDHALDQLLVRLLIIHHRQASLLFIQRTSPSRFLYPVFVRASDRRSNFHHIRFSVTTNYNIFHSIFYIQNQTLYFFQ